MTTALAPSQLDAIARACRRHRVARLHAFGSVVGPNFRPGERDIDLLVQFQSDGPGGLYKTCFSRLNDLRQTLSARIDLVMQQVPQHPWAIENQRTRWCRHTFALGAGCPEANGRH